MNTAGRSSWLDGLVRSLTGGRVRPDLWRRKRSRFRGLMLERLEDRLSPAANIAIVATAFGTGSLDATLVSNNGVISTTDGASGGTLNETLSGAALSSVGATANLSITARASVAFNDVGTLNLGASGLIAQFFAQTGDITFANPANTVSTSGGGFLGFDAGGNLSVANISTGGAVNLRARGGILTAQNVTVAALSAAAVTLAADSMVLNGALSTPTGLVTLETVTSSRAVSLGANTANQLSLTNAELGQITGLVLQILTVSGDISVAAPISPANVGALVLLNGGGAIRQAAGTTITVAGGAGGLEIDAANAVNLSEVNNVGRLAVNITGAGQAFTFNNAGSVAITSVGITGGITTNGGAVTVATLNGNIIVSDAVTAGTADVSLTAGGTDNIFQYFAPITAGNVVLAGDRMDLQGGTVNAGSGVVALLGTSVGRTINLYDVGGDPNGELRLSQTELNTITAGLLRIGSPNAGNLNVVSSITAPAGWDHLSLTAGGRINEPNGPSTQLTVADLALQGSAGVNMIGNNRVSVLAGASSGPSGFTFVEAARLTLTIGGVVSGNHPIVLQADDFNFTQAVNAGSAELDLSPSNGNLTFALGSASVVGSSVGLTDAELGEVTASDIAIGAFKGIAVSGAVSRHAGFDTLYLNAAAANSTISQTAPLSVANLLVITNGTVTLNNAGNDVDVLTGSGGSAPFSFTDAGDLTIGTIIGIKGVQTSNGAITLTTRLTGRALTINQPVVAGSGTVTLSAGGPTTQAAGAFLSCSSLLLQGAGPYTLTDPANAVNVLAANVFDAVDFVDSSGLTIGKVNSVVGVTNALAPLFAPITISAAGSLVVSSQVTGGAGGVNLIVSGAGGLLTNHAAVHGGNVFVTADRMNLANLPAGAITATGAVNLQPFTSTLGIDLGTNPSPGNLGLADADLATITGILQLFTNNSAINVSGAITRHAGFSSLSLNAGTGAITQSAPLSVADLFVTGAGVVTLTNAANDVDTLVCFGASGISFTDRNALAVGGVDVVGDVTLKTGGALTFDFACQVEGPHTLTLNAGGPVTQASGASLTAASLLLLGAGPYTLGDPANRVNVLAAHVTGALSFDDSVGLTIGVVGSVIPVIGVTTADAAIDLTADAMSLSAGAIDAGASSVSLQPLTAGMGVNLGSNPGGVLGLTQADLDTITAGVLSIGGVRGSPPAAGAVTISQPITAPAGWNTLELFSGGAVDETGSGSLTVTNLIVQTQDGIGDAAPLAVQISNLAFQNSTGVVDIENTGGLTIANVAGFGASANGGPTALHAGSPITFAVNVLSLGTLSVRTVEEAVETSGTPEDDITVLAGVTVRATGGDVVFLAADSVITQAGSLIQSDTGAVDIGATVHDPDFDGILDLKGQIVAAQGVNISPVPNNLELTLSGLATPGALPISLSGAIDDPEAAGPHSVVVNWGDGSANTILALGPGVGTFSASHVYAVEGNFAATVLVTNSALQTISGDIVVPVLPARFGPIVAVDIHPGQTATSTVVDSFGDVTTITLVRAPGPGGAGEFLAAKLLNAFFPPTPGTIDILAAYDFRQFNLSPGDRAFISVTFPAVVPPGTFPILQYLDPATGRLELFNPANPPGYLRITVGPNTVTTTLILDNTTIPKLTELTGTEFTISAALPSNTASVAVGPGLATIGVSTATGRSAGFQSTSQVTFGLAASQSSNVSSGQLALNASASGGDSGPPPDEPGAAAARAAWAQFAADEFGDDPEAVWQYGGDAAVRIWLLKHAGGPPTPPQVAPAPAPPATPPKEPGPPHEEAQREELEFLLPGPPNHANGPAPTAAPSAPVGAAKNGRRVRIERGPPPVEAPYLWAASLGGLILGIPERKKRREDGGETPEKA